jgi:photosystem II stability/assembly factor-like uncharacterized protein
MNSFLKNKLSIIVIILLMATTFSGCEIFPGVDINPIKEKDGGVFKSIEGGRSWQQKVKIDEKNSIASKNMLCLAVDLKDTKNIYAGTKEDGIYKSADGGETWFKIGDENGILNPKSSVYDIAVDPKDNNYIYATVFQENKGKVLKTSDGGKKWREIYLSQAPGDIITDIELDFFDTRVIYLANSNGGFFKSANYGSSWELKIFFERSIEKIIINPKNTNAIWIISGNQIYKSDDKGNNWQSFEEGLKNAGSNRELTSLAIDPSNPNCVYAGSSQGILKTNDGGSSWSQVSIITPPQVVSISDIAVHPANSLIIYYAAGSVLYKSIDGGTTWTIHNLRSGKTIKKILLDPSNPEIIYLGMCENK